MKRTLHLKFMLSYVLFAAIAIVFLSTFTQGSANEYLIRHEAEQLYRESSLLASDYKSNLTNVTQPIPNIQKELENISEYLNVEIWFVDANGNILLDSSNPNARYLAERGQPLKIEQFTISDFGNKYYQVGTYYDFFEEDTLTVFSTMTHNYKVIGYVIIHEPMSVVLAQSDEIVDIVFLSVVIMFICAFVVLIAFTIIVYRPIRDITKGAERYAKGDFSQKIRVKSNDEIGYLANTLNYMGNTLNTMDDEHRKFISNVSHDFRSPLTSIKGYIEAMLDGTIPVEMQEKYLNIILFETERLNKLTQGILDLNNFGTNGIVLTVTDFDINEMIRQTTMTFEGVCNKKGLSFDLVLTEKQLFVKGDMGKIQQVLYNLIDNATKFSNKNSAITIETSIRNEKVLISVKDSGIGIPSDSQKKIWDRFYKTDLSRGKDKTGTGLGLAIVKEIVQAHNENINVISTEGVGTEFIFTLPLSEKEV